MFNGAADALRAGDIARWREELIRLDQNWVKPLLSAVRAGKISLLRLVACNMEHLIEATLNRAALWRIWRRSRSVTDYIRRERAMTLNIMPRTAPPEVLAALTAQGVHPLLAGIYAARGITSAKQISDRFQRTRKNGRNA